MGATVDLPECAKHTCRFEPSPQVGEMFLGGSGGGMRECEHRAPWAPPSLTGAICTGPQGVQSGDKASTWRKCQEEMWTKSCNEWVSREPLGLGRSRGCVSEREQQPCWLQHRPEP